MLVFALSRLGLNSPSLQAAFPRHTIINSYHFAGWWHDPTTEIIGSGMTQKQLTKTLLHFGNTTYLTMTLAGPQEKETGVQEEEEVFCKSIRYYFREYCNCSSIHGFRYFGEKRTYFERTWWFVVFSLVFALCVYQIKEVYHKWEKSPVIVSFDTSETPIYSIPFPAVTICPESKSIQSLYNHTNIMIKLTQMTKKGSTVNLTEEEERNALYMSMVCDFNKKINKSSFSFSDDFFEFLNKVRRQNIFFACSWMGKNFRCEDLFVPIITDEGICFTFNILDREDVFRENVMHFSTFMQNPERQNLTWNLDDGYSDNDLEAYPRRAKFPGVNNALGVTMAAYKDDLDATCKDSLQGFRVILHTPMRIPRPSNQYFRVPLNEAVLGSIHPVMISTSDTVKVYNAKRRECYFPSERYLKYFKIYTQLNCNLECLTNFTLKICKCVNFYMPRENGTNICGASKKTCMNLAEKFLQTEGLVKSIKELRNKKNPSNKTEQAYEDDDEQALNCDCMPICSDLTYSVETSQAKWDWHEKYNALNSKQLNKQMHMSRSRLILYFKTSQFVTSKRHELYGPTDFLANFGGLLGLFTGFSILSIMEIIYFLTIRLCCNVRLYGKWYGPDR